MRSRQHLARGEQVLLVLEPPWFCARDDVSWLWLGGRVHAMRCAFYVPHEEESYCSVTTAIRPSVCLSRMPGVFFIRASTAIGVGTQRLEEALTIAFPHILRCVADRPGQYAQKRQFEKAVVRSCACGWSQKFWWALRC